MRHSHALSAPPRATLRASCPRHHWSPTENPDPSGCLAKLDDPGLRVSTSDRLERATSCTHISQRPAGSPDTAGSEGHKEDQHVSEDADASGPGITRFSRAALIQLRTCRRLTLRDLALLSGVGATTLNGWETGRRTPSPRALTEVARALGVHVAALVPVEEKDMVLRDLRHQAGFSQAAAARLTGFSQGVYQAIESGHRPISTSEASRIGAILKTTAERVLELHARVRAAECRRLGVF